MLFVGIVTFGIINENCARQIQRVYDTSCVCGIIKKKTSIMCMPTTNNMKTGNYISRYADTGVR